MADQSVTIEVDIDEDAGRPGYARIIIPRAGAAGGGAQFRIQRLDREENSYLSPHGWRSGAADLVAWKTVVDGADLVLFVGPEVVDLVPNDINVEVSVPAVAVSGYVFWPDMPTSSVASGQIDETGPKTPSAPPPMPWRAPPPEPPPPAPPVPGPNMDDETRVFTAPPRPGDLHEEAFEEDFDEELEEEFEEDFDEEPDEEPSGRGRWVLFALIGLVFLLLAGGGVAAYILYGMEDPPPEPAPGPVTEPVMPSLPTPGTTPPEPAPPEQASPEPATAATCDEPYVYVTAFMDQHPDDIAAWVAHAKELVERGGCNDVIALLLVEAADKENPEAKRFMAELADPTVEQADRIMFSEPDPRVALQYYGEASMAGNAEAGEAWIRLMNHLRERAGAGDADAQAIIDSVR